MEPDEKNIFYYYNDEPGNHLLQYSSTHLTNSNFDDHDP